MKLNRRSFLGGFLATMTGVVAAKSTETLIEPYRYEVFCANSDHINWGYHGKCPPYKVGSADSNVNVLRTAYPDSKWKKDGRPISLGLKNNYDRKVDD